MSDTNPDTERRTNAQLRLIFPAAYEALRPFFDQSTQWGGQSHEHLAYHALKEHFPELSSQDVFIIVATSRRLFAAGKFPASS